MPAGGCRQAQVVVAYLYLIVATIGISGGASLSVSILHRAGNGNSVGQEISIQRRAITITNGTRPVDTNFLEFSSTTPSSVTKRNKPFAFETPEELIKKQDFPVEVHVVQTEDGYLLKLHRIPFGRKGNNTVKKRGSVLLHHGLIASSDSWVLRSAEEDLAYILSESGYDVWLANCRGNTHSKRHITLSPKDPKFWKFGFHEIGYYDLPATIDYILNVTNEKDLYYIGHSMGTLVTYILCSTRPEYNKKFRLNISLAPVAFLRAKNLLQSLLIDSITYFKNTVESQGIYEVFPLTAMSARLGRALCQDGSPTQNLCVTGLFVIVGADYFQTNVTLLPKILAHFPAGTSVQTLVHFQQIIKSEQLRQYDFGATENLNKYGQKEPPMYDLKKVTCPVSLHYGQNDIITTPEEVEKLAQQLPNLVGLFRVPFDSFNHMDFLWAKDAKSLLYDSLTTMMAKYK